MTADEICHHCHRAINMGPREVLANLPATADGVPQWHSFEHVIWQLGETIRQELAANTRLRRDPDVQECLLSVAETPALRRGRQPFVMILGFRAAASHAPRIAKLLADPDVNGQALDTLLKLRATGYDEQVRPLLNSPYLWVRRCAKRYLKAHGS